MKAEWNEIEEEFWASMIYTLTPEQAIESILITIRSSLRGVEFYKMNLEEMLKENHPFLGLRGCGGGPRPFTDSDRRFVLQSVLDALKNDQAPSKP
ncbi:MAG: hypothetical protein HY360_05900 [Verrucomicrobia bacterium]|nr:hypothetical protein [Verrucomicrobiota bacterium]